MMAIRRLYRKRRDKKIILIIFVSLVPFTYLFVFYFEENMSFLLEAFFLK
jgi:hypothetical protein